MPHNGFYTMPCPSSESLHITCVPPSTHGVPDTHAVTPLEMQMCRGFTSTPMNVRCIIFAMACLSRCPPRKLPYMPMVDGISRQLLKGRGRQGRGGGGEGEEGERTVEETLCTS